MRILFIGAGDIGLPTLHTLRQSREHQLIGIVTQPDKPVGREQKIQAPPIKAARGDMPNVPILQPARIKTAEALAEISALQPDVVVVMAYGQILPRALLDLPKVACLNLHASLLPRWRGAAPIQAAIAAGDDESGITVMYVDEGLDTGDILLKKAISIDTNETGQSLHDRLADLAPEAMLEALQLLQRGKAPREKQDNALATIAPKLNREAGRIDWSQPADAIEREIRAFHPWPGSFTPVVISSDSVRNLKVISGRVVEGSGTPGELLQSRDSDLVIAAGTSAIELQEVQLEGKRRLSAAEFLRGLRGPITIAR